MSDLGLLFYLFKLPSFGLGGNVLFALKKDFKSFFPPFL